MGRASQHCSAAFRRWSSPKQELVQATHRCLPGNLCRAFWCPNGFSTLRIGLGRSRGLLTGFHLHSTYSRGGGRGPRLLQREDHEAKNQQAKPASGLCVSLQGKGLTAGGLCCFASWARPAAVFSVAFGFSCEQGWLNLACGGFWTSLQGWIFVEVFLFGCKFRCTPGAQSLVPSLWCPEFLKLPVIIGCGENPAEAGSITRTSLPVATP